MLETRCWARKLLTAAKILTKWGIEMDIPIGANVECSDGGIGRLTNIILNPATQTVTHVVVKEHDFPGLERLVPEESINRSTRETVYLSMDKENLVNWRILFKPNSSLLRFLPLWLTPI